MRIISKFKDYYDSSAGYGVDLTQVFLRNEERYSLRMKEKPPIAVAIEKSVNMVSDRLVLLASERYEVVHVGFCGKIYTGISGPVFENGSVVKDHANMIVRRIYWKVDDIPLEELSKEGKVSLFHMYSLHRSGGRVKTVKTLKEWFEMNKNLLVQEDLELFTEHNLVVFSLIPSKEEVIVNSVLKECEFQTLKDPFTAFQDISMFVSGVLSGSGKEMIQLADRDRITAHGFDHKSFRKEAGKRKA